MQENNNLHSSKYAERLERVLRINAEFDQDIYKKLDVKRGLRNQDGTGIVAGLTRIASVQGYVIVDGEKTPSDGHLYYRGIDVVEFVEGILRDNRFGFEEICYLLLFGRLPNREQFEEFAAVITRNTALPTGFTEDMILKAPCNSITNMLSRCVLALYSYDENPDDTSVHNMLRQSIELISRFPLIVANAYAVKRHYFDNESLHLHRPQPELSIAENLLSSIRPDQSYTQEEARLLDVCLMLHAEHGGGNNSAFTCRSLSSSGTDTYSAISAACGSLKGPKHGGANQKVMEMFDEIIENVPDCTDDTQVYDYLCKILRKEAGDGSGLIYGMGHAVYTIFDPRARFLKNHARSLAEKKNLLDQLELMERIERLSPAAFLEIRKDDKPLCANVDMYSGLIYRFLNIPVELYTPLFATARIVGWCAHRIEEVLSSTRIMRPAYKSMTKKRQYIPIDQRG